MEHTVKQLLLNELAFIVAALSVLVLALAMHL